MLRWWSNSHGNWGAHWPLGPGFLAPIKFVRPSPVRDWLPRNTENSEYVRGYVSWFIEDLCAVLKSLSDRYENDNEKRYDNQTRSRGWSSEFGHHNDIKINFVEGCHSNSHNVGGGFRGKRAAVLQVQRSRAHTYTALQQATMADSEADSEAKMNTWSYLDLFIHVRKSHE